MSKIAIEGASRGTTFLLDPNDIRIIGRDTPHKSRAEHELWQERATEPVDRGLVESMKMLGFISVCDVRRDGPYVDCVDGRRRIPACRQANIELAEEGRPLLKVVCQLKRGDKAAQIGAKIAANCNRKDVDAVTMALDLQSFIGLGRSPEEAASLIGKDVAYVNRLLRVLDTDDSVQAAVRARNLPGTAAIKLADLPREQQLEELAKIESGESSATVAAVSGAVKARKNGEREVSLAPGKRLLKKLVEHEDAKETLDEQFINGIRFALGDLKAARIGGLTALIQKVSE